MRHMAMQQTGQRDLSTRETGALIGSDKVEGTDVYNPNGDRVGSIDRVMIDKLSGRVAYAVMSFGGFLGLGSDHYPIPWSLLKYNERLGGYEVSITEDQLKRAPKFRSDEPWAYGSRDKESVVYSYYGVKPYW
jgi:hypothetical protein